MLDRLSHGPAYAIKHHLRDHSDIIREILAVEATLPYPIARHHVKSHQHDDIANLADLPLPARVNRLCDVSCDLAHSCSHCPQFSTEPNFPSTRAHLTIQQQHYSTRIPMSHPHTEDTLNLRNRIMTSENWDKPIFDLIHWESMHKSMARITGEHRKSAIKLMYKLWATNQVLSDRTRKQQTRHDHRCIRCHQLHEDFDHIFLCKCSRTILQEATNTLRTRLQTYKFALPMIQCMLAGIRTWLHSAPHYDFTQHTQDDFLLSVQTAYHQQAVI